MSKAAKPIPNGYHTITANLIVDDGARALKFYATAFGAKFQDETVCLCPQNVDDVDSSVKQAVEAGCEVEMPPTDMFWGDRFASVKDPFGHQWALATRVEELDQTEINKRKEEFLKQTAAAGAK